MATVTGAGEALFVRPCLSFLLRNHVDIYLRSDSVAGRGIARRRHLDVQYLWIQQKLAEKQFKLGPVSTFINPSDLGTKALQINRLQFLLGLLGVVDSHREHELVGKDEMSKEFHNQQFREKLKEALKVLWCNEHFGLSHYSKDMILAKKVIHVCMVSGVLSAADGARKNSEESSPDHFMLIVCVCVCVAHFSFCYASHFCWDGCLGSVQQR